MSGSIYGLFVGIDAYPSRPLRFCNADADSLYQLLGSPETSTLLRDPDKNKLVETLEHISALPFTRDDVFLFYFAGHGASIHGSSYLLTTESKTSSRFALQTTALAITSLKEHLDNVTACKQVIILDACRTDASDGSRSAIGNPMDDTMEKSFKQLQQSRTIHPEDEDDYFSPRAIISACSLGQQSWEYSAGCHGWFTYHLLEYLEQTNEKELEVVSLVGNVNANMEKNRIKFPPARRQRANLEFSGGKQLLIPFHSKKKHRGSIPINKPILVPRLLEIAAFSAQVLFHADTSGALGPYLRVEQAEQPGRELFYRAKDKQLAVQVPHTGSDFVLIDQYAITNAQLCACLNDLVGQGKAWNKENALGKNGGFWECASSEGTLAAEAPGFWKSRSNAKDALPWFCAGKPWGIAYDQKSGRWISLDQSESLPATLVTWHGADLYGRWAHDNLQCKPGSFLPAEATWRNAARGETRGLAVAGINSAEHWAQCELPTIGDVQQHSLRQPSVYKAARPWPVARLAEAASACGCIQLLGNVWEWCQDQPQDQRGPQRVLKGGCCYSSREECDIRYSLKTGPDRLDPYVGFRCAYGKEV